MKISDAILTRKHYDLLNDDSQVIFCEGVTNSGKSWILGLKFFQKVIESAPNKKQFVIAGLSTPVLEKMYIQNESSFYNMFKPLCSYNAAGTGGAKITVKTIYGDKYIYLVGYDNAKRWKDILGLKINGFLVEEINAGHDDFIAELFLRTFRNGGFLYCSANGADPDLKVYVDYLDAARPLAKYADEVPDSTWERLEKKKPNVKFRYYFFTFRDNPSMLKSEIDDLLNSIPEGSWEYITKVLGERGQRQGVIFAPYMSRAKNVISFKDVINNEPEKKYPIAHYTVGVDIGFTDYTVFSIVGFTYGFKEAIVIDSFKINKSGIDEIWIKFKEWYNPYYLEIGKKVYGVFIDSAAPIMRDSLAPRLYSEYNLRITGAYKYTIKERCDWGVRLLHQGRLLFTDRASNVYDSFTKAFYKKSKEKVMDDSNPRDFKNHTDKDIVDSVEYAMATFVTNMVTRT